MQKKNMLSVILPLVSILAVACDPSKSENTITPASGNTSKESALTLEVDLAALSSDERAAVDFYSAVLIGTNLVQQFAYTDSHLATKMTDPKLSQIEFVETPISAENIQEIIDQHLVQTVDIAASRIRDAKTMFGDEAAALVHGCLGTLENPNSVGVGKLLQHQFDCFFEHLSPAQFQDFVTQYGMGKSLASTFFNWDTGYKHVKLLFENIVDGKTATLNDENVVEVPSEVPVIETPADMSEESIIRIGSEQDAAENEQRDEL